MAFLDDLGRRISQTGQTALQKTKDMTDVSNINGDFSDERERSITRTYKLEYCMYKYTSMTMKRFLPT